MNPISRLAATTIVILCLTGCLRPNNVHIPQDISKSGEFSHTFSLIGEHLNSIEIGFSRENKTFEEIQNLIGYGGICPPKNVDCGTGIPLSIKWSIKAQDGSVIASGERESTNVQGWTKDAVYRHIGKFQAPPGIYIFNIVLPDDTPELSLTSTEIVISGPNK